MLGKHVSEKTKDILRLKCPHKGITHPLYGKHHSKKSIENNRLNQPTLKTIIRLDLNDNEIDTWVGIKNMCRILDLDDGAVCRVLKNKQNNHKGFKFKYSL